MDDNISLIKELDNIGFNFNKIIIEFEEKIASFSS